MSLKHLVRPGTALILALIMFSGAGLAQTRKHDLSVSYGVGSLDQVVDVFTDVLTIVLTLGTFAKDNMSYTGVPFLTYHYAPHSRFGFGFAVGGYRATGDLTVGGVGAGTFKETNTIAAVEIDYRWVMSRSFQLYSGLGAGVRFRKGTYDTTGAESLTQTLPTFHINALGLRFGRKVGVFFEVGAGYKGMLLGGLNAQF
jgi:hypothetical protein